jgi:hypothetical protein
MILIDNDITLCYEPLGYGMETRQERCDRGPMVVVCKRLCAGVFVDVR